jgi:hypothetical protein
MNRNTYLGKSHVSTDKQQNNGQTPPPLSQRGATRRRLTKAGIGALGVLSTLESRAGMSPMMCKSPSGALSGGLSSNYGPAPVCQGLSPGYWRNHPDAWSIPLNTLFADVFYVAGDKSSCTAESKDQSYLCSTMMNLLEPQKFDTYKLGRHIVATYLNIRAGKISFLTTETLVGMWFELQTKGYYNPTAGVQWSAEQVKNYLEATHD